MKKLNERDLPNHIKYKILQDSDYICSYCQETANEIDHIIPWSYIRDNSMINLVACCRLCNIAASNRVFDSFSDKQNYILKKRDAFLKKAIPIWTVSEFNDLDRDLQMKIESSIIVIEDSRKSEFLSILKSKGIKYRV